MTGPAPAADRESLFAPAYRIHTAALVGVITLVAFEALAVATAMPTVVADLHGLRAYGWPFTAYLLASIVGMVWAGGRTDHVGPRQPLLAGIGVFGAGLLVSGLAGSMAVLVVGRAVQGLGGGAIIVAVYVVMAQGLPGGAAAPGVRRHLGGLGAAGDRRAGAGRAGHRAPDLAAGLPRAGSAAAGRAGGAEPVDPRAAGRGSSSRRGRAGCRWRAGGARDGAACSRRRSCWTPGRCRWPSAGSRCWSCRSAGCCRPGTVVLARGLPSVVAFRGIMAGAFFGAETFLPLALTTVHGARPAMAGLPLTVGALGWAAGSWWQGHRHEMARWRVLRIGMVCSPPGSARPRWRRCRRCRCSP